MSDFFHCSEKSVLILLALLKSNNIKKVIASPGSSNADLVFSFQNDPWFEVYSSVDERSAAYIACGMAAESGEAVVLTCTGATASRNYYAGLSEAYYRKLPILAITAHTGVDKIGHLIPQCIDRRQIANDIARLSVELPTVKTKKDEDFVVTEANRAILELFRDGGGPVHINLIASFNRDFSVRELPEVKALKRHFAWSKFPEIPKGKIAIYVGSHRTFSDEQTEAIDRFCATYDAVVICDHTSGYYGRYRLLPTLAHLQATDETPIGTLDLMIHIGEVSAATFAGTFKAKEIWRVSEDGELRNPYKKLTRVFQMPESYFFDKYSKKGENKHSFIDKLTAEYKQYYELIPELPFSNVWSAQQLSTKIPKGSLFHISVSNTRRSWNLFPLPQGITSSCNVGCCGIDGCTSTLVGASLASPHKLCYLVTGDLAFFYDLNVIANRHVGKNIRIMVVNNGIGVEFCINSCSAMGEAVGNYVAAEGHFGNKSPNLLKHFVEDLGFMYLKASNKKEYLEALPLFISPEIGNKPILFEIFTTPDDETEAINIMKNLKTDSSFAFQTKLKHGIKSVMGNSGINSIKKLFK